MICEQSGTRGDGDPGHPGHKETGSDEKGQLWDLEVIYPLSKCLGSITVFCEGEKLRLFFWGNHLEETGS